jgi:hypothetical protein
MLSIVNKKEVDFDAHQHAFGWTTHLGGYGKGLEAH